jgi:hypothetical protein
MGRCARRDPVPPLRPVPAIPHLPRRLHRGQQVPELAHLLIAQAVGELAPPSEHDLAQFSDKRHPLVRDREQAHAPVLGVSVRSISPLSTSRWMIPVATFGLMLSASATLLMGIGAEPNTKANTRICWSVRS